MRSFLLLLFAIAMTLQVQGTLANGDSLIGLHYSGHKKWEWVKYGACIPVLKGKSELKLIKYPRRSICQHYEDQYCTTPKFAPNVHNSGYNIPVRNFGYGKCKPL